MDVSSDERKTNYRFDVQLIPFDIALLEKLRRHEFGHDLLQFPRFADRGHVAGGHHHSSTIIRTREMTFGSNRKENRLPK